MNGDPAKRAISVNDHELYGGVGTPSVLLAAFGKEKRWALNSFGGTP